MHGDFPSTNGRHDLAARDWQGVRAGFFRGASDIHAIHDEMRALAPVWRAPWGDVYVSRYDLVSTGLADRALSHVPPGDGAMLERTALHDWLMYQEGEAHAAIRQSLQQPFVGKGIAALRPVVAEAVDAFVANVQTDGEIDVVAAFTRAVPEQVICRLLGVPATDMPLLRGWSASVRAILDTGFDDAFSGGPDAIEAMSDYFTGLARRLLADGDLPPLLAGLPGLVEALGIEVAGRNLAFLAFAGHETTVHLLGNMLHHLAQTAEAWRALGADRRLVTAAIAETLRLESPVQKICRWPLRPVELAGESIEEGSLIVLLIGAANRDPAQFADPARFDLGRAGRQNLAFGRGAHVCIGRALAEMEGAMVLSALLDRWRAIEPVATDWMDNSSIRGLDRLVLRARPA
jgi:cytochrome P450